jgi:hypothetical protein
MGCTNSTSKKDSIVIAPNATNTKQAARMNKKQRDERKSNLAAESSKLISMDENASG